MSDFRTLQVIGDRITPFKKIEGFNRNNLQSKVSYNKKFPVTTYSYIVGFYDAFATDAKAKLEADEIKYNNMGFKTHVSYIAND